MNKIFLIIQREYVTRVRKKSFIVMTLLVPALFAAMYAIIALVVNDKDETLHVVSVIDSAHNFEGKFQNSQFIKYKYPHISVNAAKAELKSDDDLVLSVPAKPNDTVKLFAKKKTTGPNERHCDRLQHGESWHRHRQPAQDQKQRDH